MYSGQPQCTVPVRQVDLCVFQNTHRIPKHSKSYPSVVDHDKLASITDTSPGRLDYSMAFPIGLNDRYDDFRFRNANGAPTADDTSTSSSSGSFAFYSPAIQAPSDRYSSSQYSTLSDARASLQRRFTTNNVSSSQGYAPAGQSSQGDTSVPDLSFSVRSCPFHLALSRSTCTRAHDYRAHAYARRSCMIVKKRESNDRSGDIVFTI